MAIPLEELMTGRVPDEMNTVPYSQLLEPGTRWEMEKARANRDVILQIFFFVPSSFFFSKAQPTVTFRLPHAGAVGLNASASFLSTRKFEYPVITPSALLPLLSKVSCFALQLGGTSSPV